MTDPRVEAAARALHEGGEVIGNPYTIARLVLEAADAASSADPHRERLEAAPRATFESCVRRVLDRIAEEREDGHELGIDEVEARLRHALTLAASPVDPHRERLEALLAEAEPRLNRLYDADLKQRIRAALDPKTR